MFSLYTLQKAGLSQGQLEFFCWEMYSEWGRSTPLWRMTTLKNDNSQDPVKQKNQDTVTVQAFYYNNPHKLMEIRRSGPF